MQIREHNNNYNAYNNGNCNYSNCIYISLKQKKRKLDMNDSLVLVCFLRLTNNLRLNHISKLSATNNIEELIKKKKKNNFNSLNVWRPFWMRIAEMETCL